MTRRGNLFVKLKKKKKKKERKSGLRGVKLN